MRVFDDVMTFSGGSQAESGLRWIAKASPPARKRSAVWCRPSWRPNAPSVRACRADMSRKAFMVLLIGWVAAVAMILALALTLR
jgi:hypothetical protein